MTNSIKNHEKSQFSTWKLRIFCPNIFYWNLVLMSRRRLLLRYVVSGVWRYHILILYGKSTRHLNEESGEIASIWGWAVIRRVNKIPRKSRKYLIATEKSLKKGKKEKYWKKSLRDKLLWWFSPRSYAECHKLKSDFNLGFPISTIHFHTGSTIICRINE